MKGFHMRKLLSFLIALAAMVGISASSFGGSMMLLGVGRAAPAASSYQGLLDVFSTGALAGYSCARAPNAAFAAGSALCEVQRTSDNTKCTIVSKANGFADTTTANCSSNTQTIVQFCNATTCGVDKSVNLVTPGTLDAVQATQASQPILTLSSTPNGTLPAISCGTGALLFLATSSTATQTTAVTLSAVLIRTTGTSEGGAFGGSSTVPIGPSSGASLAEINGGTALTKAATDNQWYSLQAMNTPSGAINVNGSDTTGSASTNNFAGNIRICKAAAIEATNVLIAEAYLFVAITTSTDRNAMSANQHGPTSGYNF